MDKKRDVGHILYKLGGYYLIPHELMHVIAYRIIDKPYEYEWGSDRVRSLEERTKGQRLFVWLFPFVVCWILALIFHFLWSVSLLFLIQMSLEKYFSNGLSWHFLLPLIATFLIIYSGTSFIDLIKVYYLLTGTEPRQSYRHRRDPQS